MLLLDPESVTRVAAWRREEMIAHAELVWAARTGRPACRWRLRIAEGLRWLAARLESEPDVRQARTVR